LIFQQIAGSYFICQLRCGKILVSARFIGGLFLQQVAGVRGLIEKVIYRSIDGEFCVAAFQTDQPGLPPVITGSLFGVHEKEAILIWGQIVNHSRYGPQIKVDRWEKPVPANREQVIEFLSSSVIKGCGPVTAKLLVDTIGENVLEIIMSEGPHVLQQVKGIGPVKAASLYKSLMENFEVQKVIGFFLPLGISSRIAVKAFKTWGSTAIEIVRQDPYRLTELSNIGFLAADEIAFKLGIDRDAYCRIVAGLKHVMTEAANSGHCYCFQQDLVKKALELLNRGGLYIKEDRLANVLLELCQAGEWVKEGEAIFPAWAYLAEIKIARNLSNILEAASSIVKETQFLSWLKNYELRHKIKLAPEQVTAVKQIFSCNLVILTGGPGTGKTQTIKAIADYFHQAFPGDRLKMAAPTGRAARRLSEVTGQEAQTIHRLLGIQPGKGPEYSLANPLPCELLIIDEVSMLDILLAETLFDAVESGTKVLLVGDPDQLPSVGPGNFLADLLAAGLPLVKLTKIFRQAAESQIVTNAHRVNQGLPLVFDTQKKDFYFIQQEQPEQIAKTILASALRFIQLGYSLEDMQILSPMRKGLIGTQALNNELQRVLNPNAMDKGQIQFGNTTFRLGDKVMQIKNNYDKLVFNGEVGIIEEITEDAEGNEAGKEVIVRFGTEIAVYHYEDLEEIVLAYASTVHKSQGGEYPIIIMPVSTSHYIMLQRNLLYTAITRAKEKAILIGTRQALAIAVKNVRIKKRNTGLAARIAARN
jgi:exodeoxyribonuclease V alpha subunit